jgi:hypothetical protein
MYTKIYCTNCFKYNSHYLICDSCYDKSIKSGNKVVDDFIRYTHVKYNSFKKSAKSAMEFVPYDMFKNIEFIAEGGFSKVYKATWINGPIKYFYDGQRRGTTTIALKELHNSKNINSKELNEVRFIFVIV